MSPGIVSLLGFLIYAYPAGEVEKTEAEPPPPQILAYLYWVPIYTVCEAAAARNEDSDAVISKKNFRSYLKR